MTTGSRDDTGTGQSEFAWPDDWSYREAIEAVLQATDTPFWQPSLLSLLRFQRSAFDELKNRLEDRGSSLVTWDNPILSMTFTLEQEPVSTHSLGSSSNEEFQPGPKEITIPLQILTAGAALSRIDGRVLPIVPVQLADTLRALDDKRRRDFAKKWTSPIPYGDSSESPGSLIGLSRGSVEFRASLCFRIHPLTRDESTGEFYLILEAELPWEGEHSPASWSNPERAALWGAIDQLFEKLIRSTENGEADPHTVSVEVGVAGSAIDAFEIQASGDSGFLAGCSPRPFKDTPLHGLLLNKFALPDDSADFELPVTDGNGRLTRLAHLVVISTLTHPSDDDVREELIASIIARATFEPDPDEDLTLPGPFYAAISRAPPYQRVLDRASKSRFGGEVAGDMLLFILTCAEHAPEHASVRKAAFVQRERLISGEDGSKNYGRSTVLREWQRFKPAAHLWAALLLSQRDEEGRFRLFSQSDEPSEDDLITFLSLAEEIRRRAENLPALRQGQEENPILDPSSTWRTPNDLRLHRVELGSPPLDPWTKQVLSQYRVRTPKR